MPIIFAKERATYLSDQETDLAIREEFGQIGTIVSPDFINGSLRYVNTDSGPGGFTYRFSARQFQLMGIASDGGYWAFAAVIVNGVSVSPNPPLATGTARYPGGTSAPWFTSPDYKQIIPIVVTVRECPGSRGIFDNGVKLIY